MRELGCGAKGHGEHTRAGLTSPHGFGPRTRGRRVAGWGCCRLVVAPGNQSRMRCCKVTTMSRGSNRHSCGGKQPWGSLGQSCFKCSSPIHWHHHTSPLEWFWGSCVPKPSSLSSSQEMWYGAPELEQQGGGWSCMQKIQFNPWYSHQVLWALPGEWVLSISGYTPNSLQNNKKLGIWMRVDRRV